MTNTELLTTLAGVVIVVAFAVIRIKARRRHLDRIAAIRARGEGG